MLTNGSLHHTALGLSDEQVVEMYRLMSTAAEFALIYEGMFFDSVYVGK